MRYPKTIIESRWGALGTLVLLQCYGLLLAYFFAGAVHHAASTWSLSDLSDLPGHILELGVGLAFLTIFVYAQSMLLADVTKYLRQTGDVRGWLSEGAHLQGVLRILITAAAVVFYAALLSGDVTLGFPDLNLFILLAYQVFHPLASHFVGKHHRKTHHPTDTRYVSVAYQIFGFVTSLVGAAVFFGFGLWLKMDHEPAYWLMQMLGCGVAFFAIAGFLLEDIKGRYREVFVDEE